MTTQSLIRKVFDHYNTDKGYSHGYERFYKDIIFECSSLLEIGIESGYSLASWRMLLPDTKLCGIDITENDIDYDILPKDCTIKFIDSTKQTLDSSFDIIIDDGSHELYDQIATFDNYKHLFNKYYVIEDVFKTDVHVDNVSTLVNYIEQQGFNNVKFFQSNEMVPNVRLNFLDRTKSANIRENLVFFFIIVTK